MKGRYSWWQGMEAIWENDRGGKKHHVSRKADWPRWQKRRFFFCLQSPPVSYLDYRNHLLRVHFTFAFSCRFSIEQLGMSGSDLSCHRSTEVYTALIHLPAPLGFRFISYFSTPCYLAPITQASPASPFKIGHIVISIHLHLPLPLPGTLPLYLLVLFSHFL